MDYMAEQSNPNIPANPVAFRHHPSNLAKMLGDVAERSK
jgi:hypothetical protein